MSQIDIIPSYDSVIIELLFNLQINFISWL